MTAWLTDCEAVWLRVVNWVCVEDSVVLGVVVILGVAAWLGVNVNVDDGVSLGVVDWDGVRVGVRPCNSGHRGRHKNEARHQLQHTKHCARVVLTHRRHGLGGRQGLCKTLCGRTGRATSGGLCWAGRPRLTGGDGLAASRSTARAL